MSAPTTPAVLPFGSWPTPITSELVVASAVRVSGARVDGDAVYWAEASPSAGGRTQIVRRDPDGTTTDLLPEGFDARTGVHEYGGAAWWVRGGVVWFANWLDQRLYRLAPGGEPEPLTPEPAIPRGDRFADGSVAGAEILLVRERHGGSGATDVRNEVVRIAADTPSEPEVLVSGPDFVISPQLSPDGRRIVWIQWDHPSMPWDDTVLMGRNLETGDEAYIAGGPGESVSEPRWQPDGSLWFLSDRTGWWNLYRWVPGEDIKPLVVLDAEIGVPGWQLGSSRYAVLPGGRVVFARWSKGYDGLAVREPDGEFTELDLPFSAIGSVAPYGVGSVVVVAGTPTEEPGVHVVSVDGDVETLQAPRDLGIDDGYLSVPEAVSFPSVDPAGLPRTAHGLFYPPANPAVAGPAGELPPLLVVIHGGPTAAALPVLSVAVQYWTSRGFGVVDVNYGGSTGFGRAYREQLKGAWGIVDVADCLAAARHLAVTGRVDGARLAIRGGSAGGYTVLAALARADTPFSAGADHYGVADLEALAADTHKFESRYLDGLVGPYPAAREVYVERSPIHHVDQFHTPLIVLQGDEDAIVPPNQSEAIVEALRARQVPVAYLLFTGEQHGFRKAENIRRALDAELSFYSQVFGFATDVPEIEVENLPR
ncbi:dipeptidyl-peptidase 5 [Pseudonocardia pini]|uniref:dipeptidyl-peptidase 5 n=1 Tax=Pseudonocardia pini TaxID=2758030 RepID=UPI0015EFE54C|nr:prolyl oligopeptidase family serine peptidase [Pseudonocardia pini]